MPQPPQRDFSVVLVVIMAVLIALGSIEYARLSRAYTQQSVQLEVSAKWNTYVGYVCVKLSDDVKSTRYRMSPHSQEVLARTLHELAFGVPVVTLRNDGQLYAIWLEWVRETTGR